MLAPVASLLTMINFPYIIFNFLQVKLLGEGGVDHKVNGSSFNKLFETFEVVPNNSIGD